ncbi:DNA polymerase V [Aestuariicella hydrocarbonica]|uniref:DNA polymerase V n=1 Tax=Pseudomaricurvus hydrocarbonicus TaxID=1470433 RepID=A0A9E5JSQ3_9GAMM|nr:S24 family peptidase [Aestuariicella hydrocarbonica]NHO64609.1 DNA polymerase V [Aestuariicella hydrocarbonica]
MKLVPYQSDDTDPETSELLLSLDEHLIKNIAATYLARASGDSMQGLGIFDQDLLIVDRAVDPVHGDIVIAALNGELTCKVIDTRESRLLSANDKYPPINISGYEDLLLEGVVIASVRYHRAL